MIQDDRPLIRGLIGAFLFPETSDPEEVDPDSAVRCMESIASCLLELRNADQLALRARLETIAGEAEDSAYGDFVRALADNIGLASPSPG
jgi:hypothetical protein